jgi:multidrug resistance efflux pump
VAFDIEFAERTIKASMEAALKRMRQAEQKLEKAQRATGGDKAAQLAEALEEYNRCLGITSVSWTGSIYATAAPFIVASS